MRVGLSWDLDTTESSAVVAWQATLVEAAMADRLGYDSIWVAEGRDGPGACPAPAIFLTYAARKTRSVQLRSMRRVGHVVHPVRIAEETAVLDLFSRGRAGLSFVSAARQGVPAQQVREVAELVTAAWVADELRYRGEYVRFPTHTPDDAPLGASTPTPGGGYVPQWEWGERTPDYLAVTPKPMAAAPPVCVELDGDAETTEWAARNGIGAFVGADVPTAEAVERLAAFRDAGPVLGTEVVLERRLDVDGEGDEAAIGGSHRQVVEAIREVAARAGVTHLVWRRRGKGDADLFRFASEAQPLLQA